MDDKDHHHPGHQQGAGRHSRIAFTFTITNTTNIISITNNPQWPPDSPHSLPSFVSRYGSCYCLLLPSKSTMTIISQQSPECVLPSWEQSTALPFRTTGTTIVPAMSEVSTCWITISPLVPLFCASTNKSTTKHFRTFTGTEPSRQIPIVLTKLCMTESATHGS